MRIPYEALKTPHGVAYLAGAGVTTAIAGALLVSTVGRYLHEWTVSDAVRAFHQDDGQAAQALATLRTDRPTDPLPRLFLGAWEVDRADLDPTRLEVAEKLFDEAWQLDPSSRPAAVGRLVVRLRAAAARPAAQRPSAATQAEELVRDLDPSHPDVLPLRAALELLRKRPDEAKKLLEAAPAELPSRQATGAWYWNRAAARILCKDGRALDDALLAYQLRQWPDPDPPEPSAEAPPAPGPRADAGRLLTLAYRASLADPAAQGAKDFAARCARAQTALGQGSGRGIQGRFLPGSPDDVAAAWNAVGMGYMKLSRPADAVAAFTEAAQAHPREPAYAFNLAAANRTLAESFPDDKTVERKHALDAAALAFGQVAGYLAEDEARLKQRQETFYVALQSMCSTQLEAGDAGSSMLAYRAYMEKVSNEVQRHRDLGALHDWAGDGGGAVEYYRKAIEAGHKDAPAMQRRVRFLETGQ